jgi:hypothetical protein
VVTDGVDLASYTILKPGSDVQAAWDKGQKVRLQADFHRTASLAVPPSGASLYLDKGARLVKNWSGSGSTRSALIINKDWSKPFAMLDIQGPGKVEANPGMQGNMFGILFDQIYFRDFSADYFMGGRYFMGGGRLQDVKRIKIRPDMKAGTGDGGWRTSHGGGLIEDCDMWSGDDVYQAVPAGATADPLFNQGDVNGLTYKNCIGRSLHARLMVAGLQAGTDPDGDKSAGMKSGVHNLTFDNVKGFGGGTALNIAQHNSTGGIDHVTAINCVVDQRLTYSDTQGQGGEVYALAVAGLGAVDYLELGGLTILNKRDAKDLFFKKGPLGSHITGPKQGTGSLPDPVQ